MFEQLKQMSDRLDEIERSMADPAVIANQPAYALLLKERRKILKPVLRWRDLERVGRDLTSAEAFLAENGKDPEMSRMGREEVARLQAEESKIRSEIEELLLSSEDDAHDRIIVEIRPGTGGDEAALFAGDILRMYTKFAEKKGWRVEILDTDYGALGGVKEATFAVVGDQVYRYMKFESGTHRVQRVPKTETQGRIHTSACTVAILPEPEEVEIEVKREDLRIDVYRAGGAGGQHVNKTSSAVRLTHLPTGIVVACQTQRSQHQNRDLAMKWLRAKLYEHEASKKKSARDTLRKTQVGTGDRSEKIRTYNFPQSRITDHRIGFSIHNLETALDGEIDELIAKLLETEKNERMKALTQYGRN